MTLGGWERRRDYSLRSPAHFVRGCPLDIALAHIGILSSACAVRPNPLCRGFKSQDINIKKTALKDGFFNVGSEGGIIHFVHPLALLGAVLRTLRWRVSASCRLPAPAARTPFVGASNPKI